MKSINSAELEIACHEWGAVIEAMAAGEQTVMLRKGGIHDPGGRFRLAHERFVLFPTFTHQAAEDLSEPWAGRVAAQPEPGRVTLTHWAEVVEAFKAPGETGCVEAWMRFHVYTAELVRRRLAYKPKLDLHLVLLRVYRLAEAVTIDEPAGHHACVSWVELPEPVSLAGSEPVLSDGEFSARGAALRSVLGACNFAGGVKD